MNRAELKQAMPETMPSGASPQAVEAMYDALRLIVWQGNFIDRYAMDKVCKALSGVIGEDK